MDGAAMYYALMAAQVVAGSTWNPADKSANIALSNANLTATITTNTSNFAVRGTSSKSSGKYYFEVRLDVSTFSGVQIGVAKASANINGSLGSDANGWSYNSGDGKKLNNNTFTAYGSSYAAGDIIGVCLDASLGRVWFAKNNVWQNSGNPAAGTGYAFSGMAGPYFPAASLKTQNDALTARFTAAQQTYAPPSGFVAWG